MATNESNYLHSDPNFTCSVEALGHTFIPSPVIKFNSRFCVASLTQMWHKDKRPKRLTDLTNQFYNNLESRSLNEISPGDRWHMPSCQGSSPPQLTICQVCSNTLCCVLTLTTVYTAKQVLYLQGSSNVAALKKRDRDITSRLSVSCLLSHSKKMTPLHSPWWWRETVSFQSL